MTIKLILCATLAAACAAAPAQAAKTPRPLITDSRIKQVMFDPNQVYEVVANYGYQTVLEFAKDEVVLGRALGDTIAWQTRFRQNLFFLKPTELNAATNLTVLTNKHTYYLMLSSSHKARTRTFLVRFVYPETDDLMLTALPPAMVKGKGLTPQQLNLDYGVSGDKAAVALKRVFDDGQFTYFGFEAQAEIPAFYIVGPDGTESLVNVRREGDYMVVERVGRLFTLRNGKATLCVANRKQLRSTAQAGDGNG
jgi:type IV secretion system protein VirB9